MRLEGVWNSTYLFFHFVRFTIDLGMISSLNTKPHIRYLYAKLQLFCRPKKNAVLWSNFNWLKFSARFEK